MQQKSSKLTQEAEKTGLKINIQKTKLLKVNSTQQAKVQLKGKDVEKANKFTYLGSVVTDKGGTDGSHPYILISQTSRKFLIV